MFESYDRARERIEGALHDGVQQDLVGASVALQLALQLLDTDPTAARTLLAELEEQVVDALERVRGLPQELYPRRPPDDALRAEAVYGAARALRAGATRLRVSEESGMVHLDAQGRFDDAAIEQARACLAAVGGQLAVSAGAVTASVSISSSAR